MMAKARWLPVLLLPLFLPAAPPNRKPPPWERPIQTGRYLFLENCSVCHEAMKPKSAKLGPSLLRFKKVPPDRVKPFQQYIFTKVKGGGILMPPFGDTLTDDQIRQIAMYLLPR